MSDGCIYCLGADEYHPTCNEPGCTTPTHAIPDGPENETNTEVYGSCWNHA